MKQNVVLMFVSVFVVAFSVLSFAPAAIAQVVDRTADRVESRIQAAELRVGSLIETYCEQFAAYQAAYGTRMPDFCGPGGGTEPPPDADAPVPTLILSLDPAVIEEGEESELGWMSEDADTCTASHGWSGEQDLDGSMMVSPTESTTYTLACTGAGGAATYSVTLAVVASDEDDGEAPTPVAVTLTATPPEIMEGETAELAWTSTGATTCTASGGWGGARGISGTEMVSPTGTTMYTLTCEYGTETEAQTVTVVVVTEEPPPAAPELLITEVYYDVDAEHGAESTNEWIEIHNRGEGEVNVSGYALADSASSDTLPTAVIPAGGYLIVTNSVTTADFWDFPPGTVVVALGGPLGNGLGNTNDSVTLLDTEGAVLDSVSWGSDTSAFDPAADGVSEGSSLDRVDNHIDTDTAVDWTENEMPDPGM